MTVLEEQLTVDDFLELFDQPEYAEKRLELVEGLIIEMPPSTFENSVTGLRLATFLNMFVIQHNLGYVSGPDGGYRLSEHNLRQPDVAFVRAERVSHPVPKIIDGPPDLAVEIVSPREDALDKALAYLEAGTAVVWAVYADKRVIRVLRLDENGSLVGDTLTVDDELTCEPLLPGFSVPVRDIFPAFADRH